MAKPSLPAEAPKLLWTAQIPYGSNCARLDCGGVVLEDGWLAVRAQDREFCFDKHGNAARFGNSQLVGAVVESDTEHVSSTNGASMAFRQWRSSPGYASSPDDPRCQSRDLPVRSPDGVFFDVGCDHQLHAYRPSDGMRWSRPVDGSDAFKSVAVGGAGDVVFVNWPGGTGTTAYSAKDGALLGRLQRADGNALAAYTGSWAAGWQLGIHGFFTLVDTCGQQRWDAWKAGDMQANMDSGLITVGELVVVSTYDTGGPRSLALYDGQGVKVGPKQRDGIPYVAGADGTIYTIAVDAKTSLATLIAYDPDLEELWRFDLGGYFPSGSGVLDDDGVLYLARTGRNVGLELLAIQTRSPGLAESSWPNIRHDNRGTSWLTSWEAAVGPSHDAGTDAVGE